MSKWKIKDLIHFSDVPSENDRKIDLTTSVEKIKLQSNTFFTLNLHGFFELQKGITPKLFHHLVQHIYKIIDEAFAAHDGEVLCKLNDNIHGVFASPMDAIYTANLLSQKLKLITFRKENLFEKFSMNSYIGIAYGETLVTQEENHFNYFSEFIDCAQKYSEIAKLFNARIIIPTVLASDFLRHDKMAIRRMGSHIVRGLMNPQDITEIFESDNPDLVKFKIENRDKFESAVQFYELNKYEDALKELADIETTTQNDKAIKYLREFCEDVLKKNHFGFSKNKAS